MPRRNSYNRHLIRHMIDDQAGCTEDEFDELFGSSDDDEQSSYISSCEVLEDSDEDTSHDHEKSTVPASTGTVETFSLTSQQHKILKQYNQHTRICTVSTFMLVFDRIKNIC